MLQLKQSANPTNRILKRRRIERSKSRIATINDLSYHIRLKIINFLTYEYSQRKKIFKTKREMIKFCFGYFKKDPFRKTFIIFRNFRMGEEDSLNKILPILPKEAEFLYLKGFTPKMAFMKGGKFPKNLDRLVVNNYLEGFEFHRINLKDFFIPDNLTVLKWSTHVDDLDCKTFLNSLKYISKQTRYSMKKLDLNFRIEKSKPIQLTEDLFNIKEVFPKLKYLSLYGFKLFHKFPEILPESIVTLKVFENEKWQFDVIGFSHLQNLKRIYFDKISISPKIKNPLPKSFKKIEFYECEWMKTLNIENKELRDIRFNYCGITDDFFIRTRACTKLEKMEVENCKEITGLKFFYLPNSLKILKLAYLQNFDSRYLADMPQGIESLSLIKLKLNENAFKIIKKRFPRLRKLFLKRNKAKSYKGLKFLHSLEELTIYRLDYLSNIPSVQRLDIRETIDGRKDEEKLSQLPNSIQTLSLISANPTAAFFYHIMNLIRLKWLKIICESSGLRTIGRVSVIFKDLQPDVKLFLGESSSCMIEVLTTKVYQREKTISGFRIC